MVVPSNFSPPTRLARDHRTAAPTGGTDPIKLTLRSNNVRGVTEVKTHARLMNQREQIAPIITVRTPSSMGQFLQPPRPSV